MKWKGWWRISKELPVDRAGKAPIETALRYPEEADIESLEDVPKPYPKPSRIARLIMEDTWTVPVAAVVATYFASKDAWWFTVRAHMQDGQCWELSRQFQDFYSLHLSLKQHLSTAPQTDGMRGVVLPVMPPPEAMIDVRTTRERRPYLNAYLQALLRCGHSVASHYLVRGFFVPRGNDHKYDFSGLSPVQTTFARRTKTRHPINLNVPEKTTMASGLVWFVDCSTNLRQLDKASNDTDSAFWDLRVLTICEIQRLSIKFCQVHNLRKSRSSINGHEQVPGCDASTTQIKETLSSEDGTAESALHGLCSTHFEALGAQIYKDLMRRYPHLEAFSSMRRHPSSVRTAAPAQSTSSEEDFNRKKGLEIEEERSVHDMLQSAPDESDDIDAIATASTNDIPTAVAQNPTRSRSARISHKRADSTMSFPPAEAASFVELAEFLKVTVPERGPVDSQRSPEEIPLRQMKALDSTSEHTKPRLKPTTSEFSLLDLYSAIPDLSHTRRKSRRNPSLG